MKERFPPYLDYSNKIKWATQKGPTKGIWRQLVYFIITYYFLLCASVHLSCHQEEPSTRENMHENTNLYPH